MLTKKALLVNFYNENKGKIIAAILFGFLSILTTVLIPVFLGKFYQLALHTHSPRGKLFDSLFGHIKHISSYFIFFSGLVLLKFIFNYFEKYFSGVSSEKLSKNIREKIFAHQLYTQFEVHSKKETGLYLLRYSGDLTAVQHYLSKGMIGFVNDCLFIVVALVFFSLISLSLTIVVAVSFAIIFLVIYSYNKNLKKIIQKRRTTRSLNLAFITSRLMAILTIKIFNRESIEIEKFTKKSDELYDIGIVYVKKYAFVNALLQLLIYTMLGAVLFAVYAEKRLLEEKMDGAVLLVFIMIMVNTLPVFKRILKVNLVWQAGNVSINKIVKILNAKEELRESVTDIKINSGQIEATNLGFGYSNESFVFRDFSFFIKPKSLVLIEGKQGLGKSSLFKLLLGLYQANEGQLLIDNIPIEKIGRQLLRKNVSMVSDELPLLGTTFFEVVSYSRKEEKRAAAEQLLIELGFDSDITNSVLDNPVHDGGKNLSAGQRKLLKIARAVLTRKKIMLFDEPFANLDIASKIKVASLINRIKSKYTILVIDTNREVSLDYDQIISPPIQSVSIEQIDLAEQNEFKQVLK